MLNAQRLSKRFGMIQAVNDVGFTIESGTVCGFLGPNGAGKTTTLRMIAGLLMPDSGSISIDGLDVQKDWRLVRRRIGYLPESAPCYPEMRVQEYLEFRARVFMGRLDRAVIDRSLEACQLGPVRRRLVGQLSKGYRQRVGLAATLVHAPDVLILDEPTVGLDPNQVMIVRDLVKEFSSGGTVLFSSHLLGEIEAVCDHLVLVDQGRLIASGPVEWFRKHVAGSGQYQLEVDDPSAARCLGGIEGIGSIQVDQVEEGWHTIMIYSEHEDDLRETIARRLASEGILARQIVRSEPSLEMLFQNLTSRDAR
ncbi:MAG: ABC transporter [Phycisphaerae bacterium]|nr:ABC transporter [Phycisphaerae bacterium]